MFLYDRQIDQECWERLLREGPYYSTLLGVSMPQAYSITPAMEERARSRAIAYTQEWIAGGQDQILAQAMQEIFQQPMPAVPWYVNTSPYSMDWYPRYLTISMERDQCVASVWHEMNHFMLRHCFPRLERIEEIKEVVSVVNYSWGVRDVGWPIFKEQRKQAFTAWQETHDIQVVIQSIKL